MSKSINYIWFCFYFLLFNSTAVNATGILERSKTEGGHEGCCINPLPTAGLPVEITLTINGNVDASECGFPWKIKALYKTIDDRYESRANFIIAESNEINISDFYSINNNDLIRTMVSFNLFDGTEAPMINICEVSECYNQQNVTRKKIIYKIFSGDEQINQDCPLFNHPDLETESIELDHVLDICDCPESSPTGERPGLDLKTNNASNMLGSNIEYKYFDPAETHFTSYTNNSDQTKVTIYPNPVKQQMNVKFQALPNGPLLIEIISLEGKSLVTKTITSMDEIISVDSSNLANGIYVLKVKGLHKEIIKKFSVLN